jgi:hypothetical protein
MGGNFACWHLALTEGALDEWKHPEVILAAHRLLLSLSLSLVKSRS